MSLGEGLLWARPRGDGRLVLQHAQLTARVALLLQPVDVRELRPIVVGGCRIAVS